MGSLKLNKGLNRALAHWSRTLHIRINIITFKINRTARPVRVQFPIKLRRRQRRRPPPPAASIPHSRGLKLKRGWGLHLCSQGRHLAAALLRCYSDSSHVVHRHLLGRLPNGGSDQRLAHAQRVPGVVSGALGSPSELLASPSGLLASPSELLASPSGLLASPSKLFASPCELLASHPIPPRLGDACAFVPSRAHSIPLSQKPDPFLIYQPGIDHFLFTPSLRGA
jgi:hypothetical protein